MGDIRFDRAWEDWKRRLAKGFGRARVLKDADEKLLVETLASKEAGEAPVERNVIATELLNRSARREADAALERNVEEIMREARETVERSAERVKRSLQHARESRGLIGDEDDAEKRD